MRRAEGVHPTQNLGALGLQKAGMLSSLLKEFFNPSMNSSEDWFFETMITACNRRSYSDLGPSGQS